MANNQGKISGVGLLIVILLIGLLVLISISFLNTSRERARDAKRLVDIRRVQTALEFYNLEYDTYPQASQPIVLGEEPFAKLCDSASGGFVSSSVSCAETFMFPVPADPKNNRQYLYIADQSGFTISFETENTTMHGPAGIYYAHSSTIDRSPELK